jgi:hypothetical protein
VIEMKQNPPDVREAVRDEPVPPVRGAVSDAADRPVHSEKAGTGNPAGTN